MNAAERLIYFYDRLVSNKQNDRLLEKWAIVFDLSASDPNLEDDVTARLMSLRQQIDFTRSRLDEHGIPVELTNPGFERLKQVASPGKLHSSWNDHKGNIEAPECRKVFEWAAWALKEENEADLPAEELKALRMELESLQSALHDTVMTRELREFIQQQITAIRHALLDYEIKGTQALTDALHKVVGAYSVERVKVEREYENADASTKNILNRVFDFLRNTAEACDNLDKIASFGEKAATIASTLSPLLLRVFP
ncbi:hypothetical protein FNU76_01795 [Chitinimonas arctica]|uniref:Uncharacterized protein n=1 Tax=Chitinimonas arctica TaxID=2594795 RepID=A0A516SAL4_9NEIS|nr:hypothetical protein [Chitinimonas arctica]QDQ25187.1 hypothetical protein FNU76_01795 [Chitinimonas arctica]